MNNDELALTSLVLIGIHFMAIQPPRAASNLGAAPQTLSSLLRPAPPRADVLSPYPHPAVME